MQIFDEGVIKDRGALLDEARSTTSIERLNHFASHPETSLRFSAALNPLISLEALYLLAADKEVTVRMSAALSSNLSPDLFKIISSDSHSRVREELASNSLLPEVTAQLLAKDPSPRVRGYVAANPSSPLEVVSALLHDEDYGVMRMALRNPSLTPNLELPAFIYAFGEDSFERYLKDQISTLLITERECILSLLPEWSGSLHSLLSASSLVSR